MFLNAALYNPDDWLLSLNESFNITFKDAETGNTGIFNGQSARAEFNKWTDNLKKNFLHCNSDYVFLDVKQEQFLLPLIKKLMRT
jgi:hypothetical protein